MHNGGNTAIIRDYTRGPLFGNLLAFSVPFMISNMLMVVYAIVDMIVVGKVVGHGGLVGVSNASEIITMLSLACTGLSAGGQIYISQLLGSGKRDQLNRVLAGNSDFACRYIREHFDGVKVFRPQGTYMLFMDCTDWCAAHGKTLPELERELWDVGVAVQDGAMFHGPCHLRINLALPFSRVEEAFRRMDRYVFNADR